MRLLVLELRFQAAKNEGAVVRGVAVAHGGPGIPDCVAEACQGGEDGVAG